MTLTSTPRVSIVVVTYQSSVPLGRYLASVRQCCEEGPAECVIVDNASTDGTVEMLRAESAWARIVENDSNLGFARACNVGLEHVQTPYVLFLNPDALIEPATLRRMLAFLDARPAAAAVGPATLCGRPGEDMILQMTGPLPTPLTMLPNPIKALLSRCELVPIVPGSPPFKTGWVCGAIFLTRTELMRRIDGFDSRFFLYWEETDVCARLQQIGGEIWALGEAVASHEMAASSREDPVKVNGCIARHYYQSRRYYMTKHYGWLSATCLELLEFVWIACSDWRDQLRGRRSVGLAARRQAPLLSEPEHV